MIFRRKIRVPEPRGSKRMRLVKVALLAFLMTPKAALLAFVMTPILVYFYQKPPLTGPEILKTESIEARLDATQIIQGQGYQCPAVQLLYLKGPAPDGNVLQAFCGPIGEDKVYPKLTYRIALRGGRRAAHQMSRLWVCEARGWREGVIRSGHLKDRPPSLPLLQTRRQIVAYRVAKRACRRGRP